MTGDQITEIQGAARQARSDTLWLLDAKLEGGEVAENAARVEEVETAAYGLLHAAVRVLRVLNEDGVKRSRARSLAITAAEEALLWEHVATGEITL